MDNEWLPGLLFLLSLLLLVSLALWADKNAEKRNQERDEAEADASKKRIAQFRRSCLRFEHSLRSLERPPTDEDWQREKENLPNLWVKPVKGNDDASSNL